MKRILSLALGVFCFVGSPSLNAQEVNPVVGTWLGSINAGGATLRLLVEIEEDDGALKAIVTSLDQNNAKIPVTNIIVEGNEVDLQMAAIGGGIKGTLSDDGNTIDATFSQAGNNLPLSLERSNEKPEIKTRPQDPTEPYPYESTDVVFTNPNGGHTLAGTLTLPAGNEPAPAAILISGSGPQNRDEALLGHRPFLVLADHLTRAGIAVLRFDDRGVGESKGDFATATSHDFSTDVEAALAFLGTRSEIDQDRVGLIGHSEGGLIAPMVASRSQDVAYIVLLAGPGTSGAEVLLAQQALILAAEGASEEKVAQAQEGQRKIIQLLESDGTVEEITPELEVLIRGSLDELTDIEKAKAGIRDDETMNQRVGVSVAQVTSPWFRYFVSYDPRPALGNVTIPVLALNGEKDLQVPFEDNLREIEAALGRANNKDGEFHALPGLNHLFQHANTGSPSEYATIEETFSPEALDLISAWITARFGSL